MGPDEDEDEDDAGAALLRAGRPGSAMTITGPDDAIDDEEVEEGGGLRAGFPGSATTIRGCLLLPNDDDNERCDRSRLFSSAMRRAKSRSRSSCNAVGLGSLGGIVRSRSWWRSLALALSRSSPRSLPGGGAAGCALRG